MSAMTRPVCGLCGRECVGDRDVVTSPGFTAVLALMRAATEGAACECPACGQTLGPLEAKLIVEKVMAHGGPPGAVAGTDVKLPCPFCQTPVAPSAINRIEGEATQTEAVKGLVDEVRASGTGACPWCTTRLDADQMLASLRRVAPSGPWDQLETSLYQTSADTVEGAMREPSAQACPFCGSYAGDIRWIDGEEAQTEAVRTLVKQVQAVGYGQCSWCGEYVEASSLVAALKRVAPDGPWDHLEASLHQARSDYIGGAMSEEC